MKEETWKFIDGTRNHYEVSNEGRVRKDGNLCKISQNKNGYIQVSVGFIFGRRALEVHRLVAAYFLNIPKDYDGLQINHKDGDKSNNNAENLEWCTPKENQQHRINILGKNMRGVNNPMYGVSGINSPVFKGYILQIDEEGKIVGRYAGSGMAAKAVKGTPSNILRVVNKDMTYHGFKWIRENINKRI